MAPTHCIFRVPSHGSEDGISSPTYSDGPSLSSPMWVPHDCVATVRKTLFDLQQYLPEDAPPAVVCGALALVVRRQHGWAVRWSSSPLAPAPKGSWSSPLSQEGPMAPPAWAECVLAVAPDGQVECVVDTFFRAKFHLGRPDPAYDRLVARVPEVFVGSPAELLRKVEELANGVGSRFQLLGLELPPWRTKSSLQQLYKVCIGTEGSGREALLHRLEAALGAGGEEGGRIDGFTAADLEGLRAYLRDNHVDLDGDSADLFDNEELQVDSAVAVDEEPASSLTLLLAEVALQWDASGGDAVPAPPPRHWCTTVPGAHGSAMPRVRRMQDLNAHDPRFC